ncbi:MAG: UDP-N-acetylmuramoyl-L-alanyl-D-glutamate--2,6-diaminopimelate ligase, partial [Erysipelothrix sp.]|nr:UDP-N-acetylmuramoyl-L-alanyl-D-glutamate--2,6-diaminopimelate ligase [Erysipelothrix sp.]
VLGEIASQYSDFIILTEEDNRDEEVIDIAHEIKRGIKNTETLIIEDRYLAIKKSIEISKVNDLILILGKGAETFLDRGTKRENWISDIEAVYEIKKQTDD